MRKNISTPNDDFRRDGIGRRASFSISVDREVNQSKTPSPNSGGGSGSNSPTRFFSFLKKKSAPANMMDMEDETDDEMMATAKPMHRSVPHPPKGPLIIGEAICEVPVMVNVKVKMKEFMNVSAGDWVTLLEAHNLEPGLVLCRNQFGMGKVPRNAVLINRHTWNVFLDVMPWLVENPAVLNSIMSDHPRPHEMVLMFAAKNCMCEALSALFKFEVADKMARNLEGELFRLKSPAMTLATSLLTLSSLSEFRRGLVSFAISCINKVDQWDALTMLSVLSSLLVQMDRMAEMAPAELVLLMQSLRSLHVLGGEMAQTERLQASVFILRFVCPALVQPVEIGGVPEVSEAVKDALISLAKAIQNVANQTPPAVGTFAYPVREGLAQLSRKIIALLTKVSQGSPVLMVSKSLVKPAMELYGRLWDVVVPNPISEERLELLKERLGSPDLLQLGEERHPALQRRRELVEPLVID